MYVLKCYRLYHVLPVCRLFPIKKTKKKNSYIYFITMACAVLSLSSFLFSLIMHFQLELVSQELNTFEIHYISTSKSLIHLITDSIKKYCVLFFCQLNSMCCLIFFSISIKDICGIIVVYISLEFAVYIQWLTTHTSTCMWDDLFPCNFFFFFFFHAIFFFF
jgi:hypothetical protein